MVAYPTGYASCDSDIDTVFHQFMKSNLTNWLVPGFLGRAMRSMPAYMVDMFSWCTGSRRWNDERWGLVCCGLLA